MAVLLLIIPVISFAQSNDTGIDGVVIAGSGDNRIEISIINPSTEDSIASAKLELLKKGKWIRNIRIRPDSIGPITEQDTVRFTVLFDIAQDAVENALDSVVLIASAAGALLDHPRQKVTVQIADHEEPLVLAYPLKKDAPPIYRINTDEEIFQHCATDVKNINEYDDVAIYFTPKRALSGPVPEKFNYRILNPNGIVITAGGNVVSSTTTGEVYNGIKMLQSEAPGRFVVLLSFYNRYISDSAQERKYIPGIYTIETIGLAPDDGIGLFGQGQGYEEVGEWQTEGSFEVKDGNIHFVGFVSEPLNLGLPRTNWRWSGYTGIDEVNVDNEQGSVSFKINSWWRDTKRRRNGDLTAGDNVFRGETHLGLLFPKVILPGKTPMDPQAPSGSSSPYKPVASVDVTWNITGDQRAKYSPEFFCPGPVLGIPNRQFSEDGWRGEIRMNQPLYAAEYSISKTRIPSPGHSVFNVGPVNDYEPFGTPPRNLAWHIRDPETLWLSPVKLSLSQDPSIDFYAFAIYKNVPKPYDGPVPDAPPWAGVIPGEDDDLITSNEDADDDQPADQDSNPEQLDPDITEPNVSEVSNENETNDPIISDVTPTGDDIPIPVTPESINPNNDKVAALIREWIAIAEPPKNATKRANLRYDQWGREIGTAPSGNISYNSKPDFALSTPEETAWSLRTKLNSVNHCTLEEYVVAKLNNKTIAHCKGRFGPPEKIIVENFTGLTVSETKSRISEIGLIPIFTAGEPASTEAEMGKVSSQKPESGAILDPGESIELIIFRPPRPNVKVPNIETLTINEAKSRLNSAGLLSKLITIGPAPSNQLALRVKESEPHAGVEVKAGTEIKVKVYGKYDPPLVNVPDVTNLSFSQAKRKLQEAGLQIKPTIFGPAPTPELSQCVRSQFPVASTKISAGEIINLKIYSAYVVVEVSVPNVYGMTLAAAKNKLQNLGLQIKYTYLGAAPAPDKANKVETQFPGSGSLVTKGTSVQVELWTDFPTNTNTNTISCEIAVHDLTGSYENGRIQVTRENNRYVGRLYANYYNEGRFRERGYFSGIKYFEVNTLPDKKKSRDPSTRFLSAYPGKILTEINGKVAYVEGFIFTDGAIQESFGGRLILRNSVSSSANKYHDSRSLKSSIINKIPCSSANNQLYDPIEPVNNEPKCIQPSWVSNQSQKPKEIFHIITPPWPGAAFYTKDGNKYWLTGTSQNSYSKPNEYMIIKGDYLRVFDACGKSIRTIRKKETKPWDGGLTAWGCVVINEDGTDGAYSFIIWH